MAMIEKYQLTRPQNNIWYSFEEAMLQKINFSQRVTVRSEQTIDTIGRIVDR